MSRDHAASSPLPRASVAIAHVDEDQTPPGGLNPDVQPYVVDVRNATAETFDEVVLFYRRAGAPGVVFLGESNFKPNAILSLALDHADGLFGAGDDEI